MDLHPRRVSPEKVRMKPKKPRKRPPAFLSKNPLTHHLQIASAAEARRFGPHFSPLTPPKPSYPVKALHAVREPKITMCKSVLLHTLRNPHGLSEDQVRAARLQAADMIEALFGDGLGIQKGL